MSTDGDDLWQAMAESGAAVATEKDYAHGYAREVRTDLEQYVLFRVGPEWHGLPIACIEEISRLFDTTPVPRTAPFVVGIGNVRGRVMPVIDLATRLGLPSRVRGSESRMLIVSHAGEPFALVVDEVDQVVGHSSAFGRCRFGSADVHPAVHLHRIDRHQLDVVMRCRNSHRHRRLAGRRWPDDGDRHDEATGMRILCVGSARSSTNRPSRKWGAPRVTSTAA